MLFRKPAASETTPEPTDTVGKGRATPTRKQAQAARQRPLVTTDRKEAKARSRQERDAAYQRQHQAMLTGDDRYMPTRDRGRARRFARDFVDSRWMIAELFMPLAFVILVIMMIGARWPQVAWTATVAMYLLVFAGIVHSLVMVWLLKKQLAERFRPDEIPSWTGGYAFQRSFMMRRFRMPKPQVKRGGRTPAA